MSENQGQDPQKEAEAKKAFEKASVLPKIDFATFVFSLNSSALVQLGMINDPVTGQKTKNMAVAKQTIDILGMLDEKTRGNLTRDEAAMLSGILYDLRIHYVRESK